MNARPVTLGKVQVLVKKTGCCNLIENRFVEALRSLDMFSDNTEAAKRIKGRINAKIFAPAFGKWNLHVARVNKELPQLRCEPVSVADVAINSCQLMNVLANFLFPASASWRAKNLIQRASKVDACFAAKELRSPAPQCRGRKKKSGDHDFNSEDVNMFQRPVFVDNIVTALLFD